MDLNPSKTQLSHTGAKGFKNQVSAAFICSLSAASCNAPNNLAGLSSQAITAAPATAATASSSTSSSSAGPAKVNYAPEALACDPFGVGQSIYYNLGLSAQLYYLTADQPRYSDVEDYINNGHQLDVALFFGQVDVPTEYFSDGFKSEAGTVFTNPDTGETLMEYFGLRYQSVLRLGPTDSPGKYQLAIISDDGAILFTDPSNSGTYSQYLNNDGTHPSKMACATSTLTFSSTTQIPIQYDYYQGPRYNIASILMWRQIPDNEDEITDPSVLSDPGCGQSGNDTFFTWTTSGATPSVPTDTYLGLLSRGWKVLSPENFLLPSQTPDNPCCVNCGTAE